MVEAGLDGAELDEAGVASWMHSLNGLRLVLGERLADEGVILTAPSEPDSAPHALYEWLGWLLEQLVGAANPTLED